MIVWIIKDTNYKVMIDMEQTIYIYSTRIEIIMMSSYKCRQSVGKKFPFYLT